jgi:hypothetical protein
MKRLSLSDGNRFANAKVLSIFFRLTKCSAHFSRNADGGRVKKGGVGNIFSFRSYPGSAIRHFCIMQISARQNLLK